MVKWMLRILCWTAQNCAAFRANKEIFTAFLSKAASKHHKCVFTRNANITVNGRHFSRLSWKQNSLRSCFDGTSTIAGTSKLWRLPVASTNRAAKLRIWWTLQAHLRFQADFWDSGQLIRETSSLKSSHQAALGTLAKIAMNYGELRWP